MLGHGLEPESRRKGRSQRSETKNQLSPVLVQKRKTGKPCSSQSLCSEDRMDGALCCEARSAKLETQRLSLFPKGDVP